MRIQPEIFQAQPHHACGMAPYQRKLASACQLVSCYLCHVQRLHRIVLPVRRRLHRHSSTFPYSSSVRCQRPPDGSTDLEDLIRSDTRRHLHTGWNTQWTYTSVQVHTCTHTLPVEEHRCSYLHWGTHLPGLLAVTPEVV